MDRITLTEATLVWIAGILAPHTLEVSGANRAIRFEHTIKLRKVGLCRSKKKHSQINQRFKDLRMMTAVSELQHRGSAVS